MMESLEYFPIFSPDPANVPGGLSVAVGSGVAAIGAPDALGGAGAVSVYFYSEPIHAWGYVGVLLGSRVEGQNEVRALGSSCVAFGDTVVVGARGDAGTPGRVLVLSPPYGTWTYTANPEITELAGRDPARGDLFGSSVAHCFDGTDHYIAVGAPAAAPPRGRSGTGQVYIFRGLESDAPWSTSPILNPNPDGTAADQFGAAMAINPSGDGEYQWDGTLTLAVGAPGADEGQGAVYVGRTAEPGKWNSSFKFDDPLMPVFPDAPEDFRTEAFGSAVALTGGSTLAVGAPNDPNFDDMIEESGAVWIFDYVDGSFVSREGNRLYGSEQGRRLGAALAFPETTPSDAGDGTYELPQAAYLVVGAPGEVSGEPSCAYWYINNPASDDEEEPTFTPAVQLVNSSRQDGDGFATAVAASDSPAGTWSFVGAPGNSSAKIEGGGYLFADPEPAPTWMDNPVMNVSYMLRWGGVPIDAWKRFTPEIPKYLT
jgi:hypothetical protein